jgi:segregation and condensation protein B
MLILGVILHQRIIHQFTTFFVVPAWRDKIGIPFFVTERSPPMSISLATRVEAILYLKAKPLTLKEITEYAQSDRDEVQDALIALMERYAHQETALEVVETPKGYVLQLRSDFQDLVQTLIPVDLGVGALRTLATIALKGSITQTELVELRGSGAYQQVQTLVEQGFVGKRRPKDGRSYRLQVTDKFHQYFQTVQAAQNLQSHPVESSPLDSEGFNNV